MSNRLEELKNSLFQLFHKIDVDVLIKNCEFLIQKFKNMDKQIKNDNELCEESRKEALDSAIKYELFGLYELKFYNYFKNKDIDNCLKIIKLTKPLLTQVLDHADYLSDKGLNNQDYLLVMNGLKKKYEVMNNYEQSLELMNSILQQYKDSCVYSNSTNNGL